MTIATTLNRIEYTATASQTVFPYTFLIFLNTDLEVYINGTLQTLTTHYTVSGLGDITGGNVTLVTGAAVNDAIIIVRVMPLTQLTDYVENDSFPADTHEKGLDRATMVSQQLLETLGRAIKLPITSTLEDIDIPVPGGGKHLAWNSAGTALELVTVSESAISSPIAVRGDIIQGDSGGAAAKLAIGTLGQIIRPNSSGDLAYETLRLAGLLAESELTISSGNITPIAGLHNVDTESDAATDDLANILTTNLSDGSFLYIRANNTARTVVVKHAATGAGQIHLLSLVDLSLDDDLKWLKLVRRGADWYEVFKPPTWNLVGSTDTEGTITATGAADVVSITGLSIPKTSSLLIIGSCRKSGGAANEARLGFKLNTTETIVPVIFTSATDRIETGGFYIIVTPHDSTYVRATSLRAWSSPGSTLAQAHASVSTPDATITAVVIRGLVDDALITLGVNFVRVYELVGS